MNKLIAVFLFAFAPFFAMAASPVTLVSQSSVQGPYSQTRTLTSRGVLTESLCVTRQSTGEQFCSHQQSKLSPKDSLRMTEKMAAANARFLQEEFEAASDNDSLRSANYRAEAHRHFERSSGMSMQASRSLVEAASSDLKMGARQNQSGLLKERSLKSAGSFQE